MRAALFLVALIASGVFNARADAPAFNKKVAPILFSDCAACHRPGGVAPFPLLQHADAQKRARQIVRVTSEDYTNYG